VCVCVCVSVCVCLCVCVCVHLCCVCLLERVCWQESVYVCVFVCEREKEICSCSSSHSTDLFVVRGNSLAREWLNQLHQFQSSWAELVRPNNTGGGGSGGSETERKTFFGKEKVLKIFLARLCWCCSSWCPLAFSRNFYLPTKKHQQQHQTLLLLLLLLQIQKSAYIFV